MFGISLDDGPESLRSLLVVGCHPDDIEIGCGGTILTLTRALPELGVTWVVLAAASKEREREALLSADAFLESAQTTDIRIHDFKDGYLPYVASEVKDVFEELKDAVNPQLILTHTRDDLHQDHRLACELTWNSFRDHLILEYEVPKVDGDLGRPNVFVPLTESIASEKIELLHRHFPSQSGRHWFDEDTFRGLMRVRGMESAGPTRFAEAFFVRKLVLNA